MLLAISINLLAPSFSYALTSGPAEPETQGFKPAGVSDMVDLQNGSFKYNIPLLDIDGYPINLNYESGVGIDDEASWVGLGWSLNPGAINRQVRGIPDDFSGDTIETDNHVKPNITVGGRAFFKYELDGIAFGTISIGLFNNNYTGVGAEIGVNPGVSFSMLNDGILTANLGLGVSSNTQSGASLTPSINLSIAQHINSSLTTSAGFGASLGYNSRSGLKALTLSTSFGVGLKGEKVIKDADGNDRTIRGAGNENYDIAGSSINYNTEPVSPSIQVPFSTTNESFSFNAGPALFAQFPSFGGTGYRTVKQVKDPVSVKPGYGFLYAERGKNNPDAVMDFIREKDNPIVEGIPNIALPIHTPDVWTYSSQLGSGQFRLYRGGSGVFFDNQASDVSFDNTGGVDLGAGTYFHGGVTYFKQTTVNSTHKWQNSNAYLAKGDFQDASYINPGKEHVFFRVTGEKGLADSDIRAQTYGTQPLEVSVPDMNAEAAYFTKGNLNSTVAQLPLGKINRRLNRTVVSYLNAQESCFAALDTNINMYDFNTVAGNSYLPEPAVLKSLHRVDAYHKPHHISEITVTDDGGKRMVYGIPVYNNTQDEYSFAVGGTGRDSLDNQVPVPANPAANNLGVDNYYQKDHKGAYATSYLLTAILSPDYVDKTGNGISDDDLGTAIKFNYSKLSKPYKWRSPYTNATLNRGLLADPDDDKGSIVYGEKEIWYVHSIESKTKIAYFITAARNDGIGVTNWHDGIMDGTNRQRYLSQIRLYSKADMSKPIKVVNFAYSYGLCPGVLNNSVRGSGKLTLTKIWFTYGNSDKGTFHPYVFSYNNGAGADPAVRYKYMSTDRWGAYKKTSENSGGLTNEEFPYSTQDSTLVSQNVALWHLSKIDLPTGGEINVSYESNDYAYVQNKKATIMTGINGFIDGSLNPVDTLSLSKARGISVNIGNTLTLPSGPGWDMTQWFKDNFLNGSNYIYTKMCVQLAVPANSNPQGRLYDFVPCFAEIKSVTISGTVAKILFKDMTAGSVTTNPISIAAWQRIKNDYPRYAYPGFDNRVQSSNNSVLAAITAIVNAAKNMSELTQNFYQKAKNNNYASRVFLGKSFVRIVKVNGHKLGGGARVRRITINDEWGTLSGSSIANSQYGQSYDYTTTENGLNISSGVASYEPYIGNDENALKEPVPYDEKIKGGITNYFDLEKPFGESLYPSPAVTYGKVTVRDLDHSGNPSVKTGYIVNEFYTSKDFPVKVNVLPIIPHHDKPSSHYSLTSSTSVDNMSLSQGYSIELNDMDAKPKAVRISNQSGAEISSTVYNYNVDSSGALDNRVDIAGQNGIIVKSQVIGQEVEFYTDFREQVSNNNGKTINIGADVFPIGFFPFPFILPHNPVGDNTDTKTFRSACALKVIQTYGTINNVVKTENGSSIMTKNIAYDGLTGEPVVTQTQNEFNQSIYSVNLPAYWAYKGMSAAYKNLGIYLSSFTTNSHGEITTAYSNYLQAGDEIADLNTGAHYWIIYNQAFSGPGNTFKLINRNGYVVTGYAPLNLIKIVRSGFRNMIGASTATLVSLNNPIVTDLVTQQSKLQLTTNTDISTMRAINASATTYDENWYGDRFPYIIDSTIPGRIYSGYQSSVYCDGGALIQPTPSAPFVHDTDTLWTHSLARAGIWVGPAPNHDGDPPSDVGFNICVHIDTAKTYYFGFACDNNIKIHIDNGPVSDSSTDYHHWTITPHYLTAGNHIIRADITSTAGPASGGLEIYNNTAAQLESATTPANLNMVFSTINLIPNPTVQTYTIENGVDMFRYTLPDGSIPNPCDAFGATVLNPYISGFLGNWRPYQTMVFQQSRNDVAVTAATKTGAAVKNAGYINNLYSYWYYGSGGWTQNTAAAQWVTANSVTLYDRYGQQLENKDALGRYSAAGFDFFGELPAAVVSNAMDREIYAMSFEDNKFAPGGDGNTQIYSTVDFVQPSTGVPIKMLADGTVSHTGNYSGKLTTEGVVMSTIINTTQQKTSAYLNLDSFDQYITKTNTGFYPNGFAPSPNKSYLFNAWVNDGYPNDENVNMTLTMNGTNIPLKCKAVVEGWKLLEGTIKIGNLSLGTAFNLAIAPSPGYTIYIDDIRMHPFDAQMKSYAYDDATMRLMAELDENAFATFYEYDDEGLLIRVKKETEKGIMTLKESRSSYKKTP